MGDPVKALESGAASAEKRVACSACRKPILEGAKKCKHCKAWQPSAQPRLPRAAIIVATSVVSVFSVIVTSKPSAVGSAPPLTPLGTDSATTEASPAAVGPEVQAPPAASAAPVVPPALRDWKTREFRIGDVHPLDLAFSKNGESVYVSCDDATVREYRVSTGEMLHKAPVPAKGDEVHLLFDRWLAVLRHDPIATRIPVVDVTHWDRDPVLLDVGAGPGDIEELPDGTVATATTTGHRVSRFALPSGKLISDMRLPQSTGQLFLVRAEGRPYLGAMGALSFAGRPAGAWIDLFDPDEVPFGATRRSIAVGNDPRAGAVTSNGGAILFPNHTSGRVTYLAVERQTDAKTAEVGEGPLEAFLFANDSWGLTLNAGASTATLVALPSMQVTTLMLPGVPRTGVMTPDRTMLFVALGSTQDPPRGKGVALIAGEPPAVVATLPSGDGAIAVAVARDGARAAVANYFGKSLTILE
ncbi:MAG: hypothetical protein U0414_09275 [Polyangiaceae bacterium]